MSILKTIKNLTNMKKATLRIKLLNEEQKPIVLQCDSVANACMKMNFLQTETFEEAVELEVIDENGKLVESAIVRPA